jgi:serine/threonine protein kinase
MDEDNQEPENQKTLLPDSGDSHAILPDGKEKIPLGSGVITRVLGHGGTATIYEIWNPQLEIYRAVKLFNPGAVESALQRFQTEIKICAKLKHPNIVEIYSVGEWMGLPYIEMEKISGTGLDYIISSRGALPAAVCTSVGIMICKALDYAHNQDCKIYGKSYHGVIHRDLKPQNIMVCSNGVVKLMDFGIARPIDTSFQTMDGLISGTLQFLSPEQLAKGKLDFRTDIYSLGVTMYEMFMGVNPFPQTSFINLISYKTKNKFRPIENFSVKIPRRLKLLIYKCMHHDPAKRVSSVVALLDELLSIHSSLTTKSPERIMAEFILDKSDKKNVFASRRRFPLRSAVLLTAIVITVIAVNITGVPAKLKQFSKPAISNVTDIIKAVLTNSKNIPAIDMDRKKTENTADVKKIPDSSNIIDSSVLSAHKGTERSVRTAAVKTKRIRPLLENLKNEYGTDDLSAIMEKALQDKNYSTVLAVYDLMSPEQAKSQNVLIFKLRALSGLGDKVQLAEFLQNTDLNDGEFYLAKAKQAYKGKNIPGCKLMLEISLTSPHILIDYEILKREVYYYMALCETALFDAGHSEETYKNALDAWWQLKMALRSEPGHIYNKKAASELQRMAKEMQ